VAESGVRLEPGAVACGDKRITLIELHALAERAGYPLETFRKAYLSPRTVAFNVQGIRVAVHRVTGEILILQSVHAADIGRVLNPMQARGQIDGGIAMGLGYALYERMIVDDDGAVTNATLRNYRIPAFADLPRNEIVFADTYDRIGPLGAKSQGECCVNPIAPAVANAVAAATGVRFAHLPLTADRVFSRLPDAQPA
jgi:CO/xanthine dehydrogenase Mo-binding subunit